MNYFYTLADLLRYNKKHKIIKQGVTYKLYLVAKDFDRQKDGLGRPCFTENDLFLLNDLRELRFKNKKHNLTKIAKLLKTTRQTLTEKRRRSVRLNDLVLSDNNYTLMKEIKEEFAMRILANKPKRKQLFLSKIILILETDLITFAKIRKNNSEFEELVKSKDNYLHLEEIKTIFNLHVPKKY